MMSATAMFPNRTLIECTDSRTDFKLYNKGKLGSCSSRRELCRDNKKVQTKCPVTCSLQTGLCPCEDAKGKFQFNFKKRTCSWVRKQNTAFRCSKIPMIVNCPKTCKVCRKSNNKKKNPFNITLKNMGTNTNFDPAFKAAKAKWESIIKGNLPDIQAQPKGFDWFRGQFSQKSYRGSVDDLVIGYEMKRIDGRSNILGYAGATYHRSGFGGPISGIMVFDSADFEDMSQNDAKIIILHEMGHVLGLVNVQPGRCYSPCNTRNYKYGWKSKCNLASNEYDALNLVGAGPLKVENGNEGGECGHWEEDNFPKSSGSSELMTGRFESGYAQPITRVTIAALQEAYEYLVDYSAADRFPFRRKIKLVSKTELADGRIKLADESEVLIPDSNFTIVNRMGTLSESITYYEKVR